MERSQCLLSADLEASIEAWMDARKGTTLMEAGTCTSRAGPNAGEYWIQESWVTKVRIRIAKPKETRSQSLEPHLLLEVAIRENRLSFVRGSCLGGTCSVRYVFFPSLSL